MSYRVSVVIRCDEPQCPRLLQYTRENRGGLNKKLAAIYARSEGWWTAGGKYLAYADPLKAKCPEHRPREKAAG